MLPAQKLYVETVRRIKRIARKLAAALHITGPFNMQLLARDNDIKVIELNLRASRSFPFVSKTFGVNFAELATRAMMRAPVKPHSIDLIDVEYVCVKAPMFSASRLTGADAVLRVEMSSTGEVGCFSYNALEGYLKALLSTGFKLPKRAIGLSIGPMSAKIELLPAVAKLRQLGFALYGTPGTSEFYASQGIDITPVSKSQDSDGLVQLIRTKGVDCVINCPTSTDVQERTDGYRIRRAAVDSACALVTNTKLVIMLVECLSMLASPDFRFEILSYDEYISQARIL